MHCWKFPSAIELPWIQVRVLPQRFSLQQSPVNKPSHLYLTPSMYKHICIWNHKLKTYLSCKHLTRILCPKCSAGALGISLRSITSSFWHKIYKSNNTGNLVQILTQIAIHTHVVQVLWFIRPTRKTSVKTPLTLVWSRVAHDEVVFWWVFGSSMVSPWAW